MNIRTQFLRRLAAATIVTACMAASAFAQSVSFTEPADGATVSSPFKVKFAVAGMDVKPAGEIAANSGHHHLLINKESIKAGDSVPFDDSHLHFGKGQTEAEVKLAPGVYSLTMQFANGAHQSYGPALSNTIKVTVK
ncbi:MULTISPECIES: DUF4399 domain-containing protein [unclassified Janthinobacterium]|uniref:DUF4399 domain-containing protein n=1 Tax=unclassified Janthinobacterium TaxID=2610881 RepID=UPI00034DCFEA|nr:MULTISPECIES: DUF4399 domain-containing protein [unclassified Janthinobacterium]MEC5162293.1 hypothetical protein [Janthinobacterium sp. CG_S6]